MGVDNLVDGEKAVGSCLNLITLFKEYPHGSDQHEHPVADDSE